MFQRAQVIIAFLALAGCSQTQPSDTAPAGANTVRAVIETPPVASPGDAADDTTIWVNPADPALSLIIGTDKQRGLHVYDVEGRLLQTLPDGRLNNVDLRDGFQLGGRSVTVVAASNRSDDSIVFYLLDPATRELSRAGDPVPTGLADPYGLCMYKSAVTGGYYVFVNNSGDGAVQQWRLRDASGRLTADLVREFVIGHPAEGCAADDELARLYVAEENTALWWYSAEPNGGEARTQIDRVDGPNGLRADIEGIAIWQGQPGQGYLVVSNQGASNFAVYRREGANAFMGVFYIVADSGLGIDGASATDGLDVTSRALGPLFPDGLLVVQDGRNTSPSANQNFKYVSWLDIAVALGLPVG